MSTGLVLYLPGVFPSRSSARWPANRNRTLFAIPLKNASGSCKNINFSLLVSSRITLLIQIKRSSFLIPHSSVLQSIEYYDRKDEALANLYACTMVLPSLDCPRLSMSESLMNPTDATLKFRRPLSSKYLFAKVAG